MRFWGAVLIAAGALVFWLAQGPIWRFLRASGAPVDQRALAGASAAAAPIARGPVRVVILDGLSLDDAPRVPSLARVCAGGLALTVDVGFPTKSLPSQFALWTGLTSQQAGLSFDNDPMPVPAHAIPAQVPGAIAVVESSRAIAGSFGFARLLPGADADAEPADDDGATDAARVAAWHQRGFAAAADDAVASDATLVLVHVLAIDDAAHAAGRASEAYARALAYADDVLAGVVARVPAGASLLVLADHGHIARGGHGDAERDTRFVRACIAPSPHGDATTGRAEAEGRAEPEGRGPGGAPRAAPAIVHLVDLSRYLADRTGATLDPDARGRPLAIAIAHADPDATLPSPGAARWIAAIAIAAIVLVAAFVIARPTRGVAAIALAAPIAAIAIAALVPGLPTLSRRPHLAIAWLVTALPLAGVAARRARAIVVTAPPLALALACAILSGVPAAIAGGAPARVPIWTGELTFWLAQLAAALAFAGVALVVRRPDSQPQARREAAP